MSIQAASADVTVLGHALSGACDEMGEALKRSAFSPNIKERQDYSCALFDARARLLAQAAHLPVHLGSMPASVRAVVEAGLLERLGDVALVNDPFRGGTHLPDLTMVAPVFEGPRLLGYAANRAHHADIGGAAAGSMSPQTDLIAEGLVIPPVLLVRAGVPDPGLSAMILANTRTPDERAGDLAAQRAACEVGSRRLAAIARRAGSRFGRQCEALLAHSRALMLRGLSLLRPGAYEAVATLEDDGAGTRDIEIRLRLKVTPRGLEFDFAGSARRVAGGVNAVLPVTVSACLYAALAAAGGRVPVNQGCLDVIAVHAPPESVVNAGRGAPVAGGNVETSQRIVDVCFEALRLAGAEVAACAQGTMNNLTLGGSTSDGRAWTYYETIAGGYGATPQAPGAGATHSHMTNTLNTPIEALEHAFPLRVEEYALREAEPRPGETPGGAGIVRRIRLLAPASFGLLTERRESGPPGLDASPGLPGENLKLTPDGASERLPAKCAGRLEAGEAIEIRTPTGGNARAVRTGRVSPDA